jgi:hypothetical protein
MKRAIRRHHRQRLKRARQFYHLARYPQYRPADPKHIAVWVNTPCLCSCWGCGNQRHVWGKKNLTMQERRFSAHGSEDE